ncbi:MAG: protein kinase [Candidatus Wallbacteria bacterium]|nr:protein kinase [Candidatus Wallbacteria bacterium]
MRELDLYDGEGAAADDRPTSPVPEAKGPGGDAAGWIESVWSSFPRAIRERYRSGRRLGEGGMGIVVEAQDRVLDRLVAVKGLRDPVAAGAAGRERQAREARIAASMTHPNILPVFDIWNDAGGNPWCSMLRVPGDAPTLARRLEELAGQRELSQRPVGELLETFLQVCRAVSYAHGRGILHRDLKPDNVLLGPSGEALVADWGLARASSARAEPVEAGPPGRLSPGQPAAPDEPRPEVEMVGTRGYAAPEQLGAFGEPRADERSDVYSLGVILFEMLAGRRHSSAVTWAAGWGGGPPRPQSLDIPARLPRELADVIRRATAWEPEERLASVEALRRAVELYLAGGLIEGMAYTPWERARKWARAHPGWVAAVATALAFSGLAARSYGEARRALAAAHGNLALSHTGWAAEALRGGLPDVARLHAALALSELAGAPAGFTLPSGAAHSILAGPPSSSPLAWAVTLDAPAEVTLFGPGGGTLLAATRGGGLWSFELPSGRVTRQIRIPKEEVWGIAVSPDGKRLATAGADRLVRLWDPTNGREVGRMQGHTEPLWALDFAPGGDLLVTGGHDRTVRLWDTRAQRALAKLEGHTGQVWCVAVSPDGRLAASGDTDRVIRVWDVPGRRQLRLLEGHKGPVLSLAFSPDGRTLASGSDDRVVRLWALEAGGRRAELGPVAGTGQCLAFSPDGQTLASGHGDYSIRLWDVAAGRERRALLGHTNWLSSLEFSADGRYLASASQDQTLRLWDAVQDSGPEPFAGHRAATIRLALSGDGRKLATAGLDRKALAWELTTGKSLGSFSGFDRQAQAVAFDGSGELALAGSVQDAVEVREAGREAVRVAMDKEQNPHALEFAPGCGRLAMSTTGGVVRVVDARTGAELVRIREPGGETQAMAFSPDGRRLATGGTYRDVLLWDAATGALLARGSGHRESVECLRFSPDGRLLVSGSQDFSARLWRTDSMEGSTVATHAGHVWAVGFSPDGGTLATGGLDGKIRLWVLPDGRPLGVLEPNASSVTGLAFTPDGAKLVSCGGHQPQVWDLAALRSPQAVAQAVLASSFLEIPAGQLAPVPRRAGHTAPPRMARQR